MKAIVIPSGEGKTTLTAEKPDKFFDADVSLDWSAGGKIQKMLLEERWEELKTEYRSKEYPEDKILLVSSIGSVPYKYDEIEIHMLKKPTGVRYNIGNRISIKRESKEHGIEITWSDNFEERNYKMCKNKEVEKIECTQNESKQSILFKMVLITILMYLTYPWALALSIVSTLTWYYGKIELKEILKSIKEKRI